MKKILLIVVSLFLMVTFSYAKDVARNGYGA